LVWKLVAQLDFDEQLAVTAIMLREDLAPLAVLFGWLDELELIGRLFREI
jgi:hypothetical protein